MDISRTSAVPRIFSSRSHDAKGFGVRIRKALLGGLAYIELRGWRIAIWLLARRRLTRLGRLALIAVLLVMPLFILLPSLANTARLSALSSAAQAQGDAPALSYRPSQAEPSAGEAPGLSYATQPASQPLSNGQKNLLVLLVDRLDRSTPQLLGAWLVLELPGRPLLTLAPIYPAALHDYQRQDEELAEAFSLTATGKPHPSFTALLADLDLWWGNYLVIDQAGLDHLQSMAGAPDRAGASHGSNAKAPETAHAATEQRALSSGQSSPARGARARLLAQAGQLQTICENSLQLILTSEPAEINAGLGDSIRTDLMSQEGLSGWSEVFPFMQRISCEFPTMPELAPTPIVP